MLFDEKVGVALTRGLDLQSRPIGKSVWDARLTVLHQLEKRPLEGSQSIVCALQTRIPGADVRRIV